MVAVASITDSPCCAKRVTGPVSCMRAVALRSHLIENMSLDQKIALDVAVGFEHQCPRAVSLLAIVANDNEHFA